MIKILYIYPRLIKSGPTNQLFNIISNLDRDEFDPYLLSIMSECDDEVVDNFKRINVAVDSVGVAGYYDLFKKANDVIGVIDGYSAGIIHSTQLFPDIFTLLSGCSKCVVTVRGDIPVLYSSKYGVVSYLIGLAHLYFVSRFKNIKLVSCSESTRISLFDKYNVTSVSIPNGVNEEIYFPLQNNVRMSLKESLDLGIYENIYISTGSLDDRKDMETVIDGWLNSEGVLNSVLLILGDGYKYDYLKMKYSNNGNVRIVGKVEDVASYLQISDYFISASHSEGLPNSVLEAMSCGLVSILSDIPPHREISLDNNVEFFAPGDLVGLSSCINKTLRKNYIEVSKKTKENISDNFSARKMSEQYQEMYFKLYGG